MRTTAFNRQRGLTLVEVSLAVVIAGIVAGWGLWALAQNVENDKARIQGAQLAMLGAALSDYSRQNFVALANGSAVSGVASPAQPTVAELQARGFLDPTFSATSRYQTGYLLRATRSAACSIAVTAPGCAVTSIAALSAPMTYQGRIAWVSLGEAVNELGAHGGFSSMAAPTVISGTNGVWTSANPVGGAGILAYRDIYSQSDNSTFLRRDGAFPMTGNLQLGGNDIRGGGGRLMTEGGAVNTAGGTIQTQGGSISAGTGSVSGGSITGSSVSATGSVSAGSIVASGPIWGGAISGSSLTTSGAVSAGTVGANAVNAASVSATNISGTTVAGVNVTASGTLSGQAISVTGAGNVTLTGGVINGIRVASVGGGCSPAGSLSVSGQGEVLSCQGGQWRRQSTNADGGLIIDRIASEGGGCSPAGAIARTSLGGLLACQSGRWQALGAGSGPKVAVLTPRTPPSGTVLFALCYHDLYGGDTYVRSLYFASWRWGAYWDAGATHMCHSNVVVVYQ